MKELEKKKPAEGEEPAKASPAAEEPAAESTYSQPAEDASAEPAKVANIAMIATLAKDEQTAAQAEAEAKPAEEPQAEAEAMAAEERQPAAPATVAHCSAEETVAVTDAELQSRTDPAASHGAEPVATASPEAPVMVNAAEVEKLFNEAYLRGRNEAVKCRMIADTSLFGDVAAIDTTGMRADFSSLFETRKSVWGNTL